MTKSTIESKKGATVISSEIIIQASKERVWNVLSRVGEIEKFHPLVKSSKTVSNKTQGPGVLRHCELWPMGEMTEEVVEWDEGESITHQVVGGKLLPPYLFMKGHVHLEALGGQTKVVFSFSYHLKYGILGKLMNRLFIKSQFKKAPPKYVQGLKEYVESQKTKET